MLPPLDARHRRTLVLIAGAVVVLGIAIAEIRGRRAALDNTAPAADTTAAAISDLDGDRQPDALPLRRLDRQPGGNIVIDAIAASGGYAAWAAHHSAAFELESVVFDERGAIAETRTDRVALRWTTPPRVRIEAVDGSTVAALGADGPWGAARGTDGRWQVGRGPGAWDRDVLRDHLRDALWTFALPFNLGDVDAALSLPAPVEGDSLDRVLVTYAQTAGPDRVYELGFSRDPDDLVEVRRAGVFGDGGPGGGGSSDDDPENGHASGERSGAGGSAGGDNAPAPAFDTVLRLEDYQQMGFSDRPLRRTLYRLDAEGNRQLVHEQRISKFRWDPENVDFEQP